jgi:hypothetical protein
VNKLNEGNKNANANDMLSAHNCDQLDHTDVMNTCKASDLHDKAALDCVEVDKVDKTNNAYGHASTDSDNRVDVENKANDEQADLMIHYGFEKNKTSTTIEQELQVDNVTHKQQILSWKVVQRIWESSNFMR